MQVEDLSETLTASGPDAPSTEHGGGRTASPRGAKVALFFVIVAVLGVGGFLTMRVKQALVKKDQVAAERTTAQAAVLKKPTFATLRATPMTWTPVVDITGTLRPWREADVGFELGGRLVKVNVAAGDAVKAGATLAVLDGSRAVAEVGQAEAQSRAAAANLALAEDNLRRTESLAKSEAIAEAQVLQARSQVALMRAQLDGANATARMARTGAGLHVLSAPFDGLVTKAPTAAGGVVQPGAPLLRVEDLSRFRLSASLGEEDASALQVGSPVDVLYRDRKVKGRVITLVPSLDQATRRAPIEIQVENDPKQPLLAYGFVHAIIAGSGQVPALRIPPAARRPGSQDEVVKVEAGHAKILHVAHAVDTDGSWIVTRGLEATDDVVLLPPADVKDGDALEVGTAVEVRAAPPAPAK